MLHVLCPAVKGGAGRPVQMTVRNLTIINLERSFAGATNRARTDWNVNRYLATRRSSVAIFRCGRLLGYGVIENGDQ